MSDGIITQVQLPNGTEYDIADSVARQMTLDVTYTPGANNTPGDLAFSFITAASADNEEF